MKNQHLYYKSMDYFLGNMTNFRPIILVSWPMCVWWLATKHWKKYKNLVFNWWKSFGTSAVNLFVGSITVHRRIQCSIANHTSETSPMIALICYTSFNIFKLRQIIVKMINVKMVNSLFRAPTFARPCKRSHRILGNLLLRVPLLFLVQQIHSH